MLDLLIKISLKNRLVIIGFVCLVLVYGSISLSKLPVDVFPELTKPTITVMTEAHGRAPEEVETLVTIPLEYSLTGLPEIERIRSTSGIGLSVIYLEFQWGTDLYRARQLVGERIRLVQSQLPSDVEPFMAPVSSLMGQIQQIAISTENEGVSPTALRTFAEWTLRPRLMMIPGVSQVIAIGGGLKQYQILVSSEKLNQYQIDLETVDRSLSKISRNTSGGFFVEGHQEILVRNIGAVSSIEEIKNTLVGLHFGKPVFVKDVADVKIGNRVKRGDASYMGKPAVVMVIQKQPGANTVAITDRVDAEVEQMKSTLPPGVIINTNIFKQSNFIRASINGVLSKLKLGTVLVLVVLVLFLMNFKMSLITLLAIPLSFFISFITFRWFGLSVNTMTLGGLAIAIGELVDDSIVDVENIHRRIVENQKSLDKKPLLQVVFQASSEVRNSIVLATVIIGLVFIPLFQLSGLEGRLFTPLAIAYLTSLFASLLVSLTVTPVLSSLLLAKDRHGMQRETWLVSFLKKWDQRFLSQLLERPKAVILTTVILFLVSLSTIFNMGSDFLPKFNEGTAMIAVFSPPGTSLEESNRIGLVAEKRILEVPEVKSVSRRTGRSERDEHAMGVNVSEVDVDFKKDIKRSREEILNSIREKLATIPNIGVNVGQPISHLMDHTLSGVSAQIAIKIFGEDLDILRLKAAELKETISDIKGIVDLQVEQQGLIPQLKVYTLREEAAKHNLNSGEITSLLESAFNGHVVGSVIEGQKFFDLFYRFDESSRNSQEGIKSTILKTMPDGTKVKVQDIADVYKTTGPNEIGRENGLRRIVISANVSNSDLVSAVNSVKDRIREKISLPQDYFITYGGQFEAQETASKKIYLFGVLAILGIMLILLTHFRSFTIVSQIMLTIPFSFIGGLIALYLSGQSLTIASLIGFVTLCGISSRNGIMMISHYLHLVKYEGETFCKKMIIRGSLERLTPVLMTASVAALALLPIALASGQPGSEILHPVATVIVGGLISSTLLDILVTPTIFFRFGRTATQKYINRNKRSEI
ncbi:MAG: efflux RND transporter permease subunit [Bdellovibrionales bacterium]|nr:efflux RND transporter permease subunit [Bdellovibrionales bacterium]